VDDLSRQTCFQSGRTQSGKSKERFKCLFFRREVGLRPTTSSLEFPVERTFTRDFTSRRSQVWTEVLSARFSGQPGIHGIEIGCFEGRSTVWFLENVLTHETSSLTCVDPWAKPLFQQNIEGLRHKVRWMKTASSRALRDSGLPRNHFHFVYIDGNHSAASVLEDAVLSYPLLISGGILIFDDYTWHSKTPKLPHTMPRLAIDSFISVYAGSVSVLHMGRQVLLEKVPHRE
jgi:hypothetical protein